jgi:hypothetical protein
MLSWVAKAALNAPPVKPRLLTCMDENFPSAARSKAAGGESSEPDQALQLWPL